MTSPEACPVLSLLHAAQRKIAEHQAVACRRIGVVQRAFHFEPLKCDARHPVLLGQRVDVRFLAPIYARPEQTHGVRLNDFIRAKEHFDLLDGWFGREIKRCYRPGLAGTLRVDTDGFVAAARPDLV